MTQNCPKCGSQDAYVGITTVECINQKCSLYSRVLQEEVSNRITVPAPPIVVGSMHQKFDDFTDSAYWAELMFNAD
jgi:hypothetical protein